MPRLFAYCIPIDDGAAPNPFWGRCTLVICKPTIRRVADVGDWIVGTGSCRSPIGDRSGQVVYAMRVGMKLTMAEYDAFARRKCPNKIPEWSHADWRRRLGDAIYDFSCDPPKLRPGVHSEGNRVRDLGGEFALVSDHFFYFGDQPRELPAHLRPLARQIQGHRSRAITHLLDPFLTWLKSLRLKPSRLYGNPQYRLFEDMGGCLSGCGRRKTCCRFAQRAYSLPRLPAIRFCRATCCSTIGPLQSIHRRRR